MSRAMVGPDGKIREFNDYKREAEMIAGQQMRWLRTEYDSTIGGAQMAALWKRIQEQKETFPLLRFDAVIDDRTSDICRALNGVTLPVDHPFWLVWYPPNHYNERATVRQLKAGRITPDDKIIYPEKIPAIFKVNLGERGLIFPPGHPYYTDVPAHVINNATLYMPIEAQYLIRYKSDTGAELSVHRKTELQNKGDLTDLIRIGKLYADKDVSIDILPEIHMSETKLRKELLPGAKTNPDLRSGSDYAEVETPSTPVTRKKLQRRISEGAKQADNVVVVLYDAYSEADLRSVAEERFNNIKNLKSITYVTLDGEFVEVFK